MFYHGSVLTDYILKSIKFKLFEFKLIFISQFNTDENC